MRSVETQDNYVDDRSARSSELVLARAEFGEFELTVCTDGTYKLDGGAMFGVVPKPLWEKRAAAGTAHVAHGRGSIRKHIRQKVRRRSAGRAAEHR